MSYLMILHIIVTLLLTLVILVQKSEGGASLFSSSMSMSGAMTARGTENFLTKCTWILVSFFIGNCLVMGAIARREYDADSGQTSKTHEYATLSSGYDHDERSNNTRNVKKKKNSDKKINKDISHGVDNEQTQSHDDVEA